MPTLIIITRDGRERAVEAEAGLSVMEIVRDSGIDEMQALCGGSCSCATCHVYIDPAHIDRLPPVETDEGDLLDCAAERRVTSRLSCQVRFDTALNGMRVTIAPED
ncbi:2Fe-2S iron-sulfur cluster-binding protein [Niveispirillum fermenti]|uniref:2Fe-2S iron-sulfur cluster-binding protein n=1 Tax=Niveispirillum fermenti TaxID=1233113 RepID=UPI003A86E49A